MSGTFRNLQMTTLLAVSLAVVMIQRAEGYSHKWGNIFSYGDTKEPTTGDGASSSSGRRVLSSLSENYRKETEVAGEVIPYERFWSDHNDKNGNLHVNEGLASRRAQDNEDDADDDALSDEYSDDYTDEDDDEDASSKDQKFRPTADLPNEDTETGISSFGDNIVFPDRLPDPMPDKLVRLPVPKCKGSTFCLNPPHYPSDAEIEDALKRRFLPPVTEPPSIAERISPTDESLCVSRERLIIPKTAATNGEEWDYVLNTGKYEQSVKVELCEKENAPCQFINNMADGYSTFCKQKYVHRNLVALDANGAIMKAFKMPSSCCCHVKFVGNPMLRMGLSAKQSPVLKRTGN